MNYIGYVEGRDLNSGEVDVIVCDGFVGNVALKISEGLWETISAILKWEAQDNIRAKVAYFLMKRAMRRLEKRLDYSEYGGAPLLGINGNCVISHGSSNGKAIMNAILLASNLAKNRLNEHLTQELKEKQDLLRLGQKRPEKVDGVDEDDSLISCNRTTGGMKHWIIFSRQEQQMIRDLARKVAREKMLPVRAELDEKEEFPWEIVKISAEAGLMGVSMPEEYEGFGGGILEYCLVAEELSRVCLGIATSVVASGLGAMPILLSGSPEQKKKYLPDIAKGKKLAAFGLTEADAGSDAGAIRTTATRTERGLSSERDETVDHQRRRGGDLLRHCDDGPIKGSPRGERL